MPTARQALASTRKLLKDKQDREQQAPAWQDASTPGSEGAPGYQSGQAKQKAGELHAAEIRLKPIGGSVGTRDRMNQAKRDKR